MIDRLKTLRKSITTVQREGQAPRPTKSGWDSADTESYWRIQMLALRKVRGIVRFWKFRAAWEENYRFQPIKYRLCLFVAIAEKNDYN